MVRAENSHGLSVPSALSAVVKTGGSNAIISQQSLEEARDRLGTKVIEFKELFAISSTSVRVIWEVRVLRLNIIMSYGGPGQKAFKKRSQSMYSNGREK